VPARPRYRPCLPGRATARATARPRHHPAALLADSRRRSHSAIQITGTGPAKTTAL